MPWCVIHDVIHGGILRVSDTGHVNVMVMTDNESHNEMLGEVTPQHTELTFSAPDPPPPSMSSMLLLLTENSASYTGLDGAVA